MNSGNLGVWMPLLSRLPASWIWRSRKRPDLDTRFRELSGGGSAAWVGGRARVLPPPMLQDVYAACLACNDCVQMMRGYGGIAHLGQICGAVAPILGSLLARVW